MTTTNRFLNRLLLFVVGLVLLVAGGAVAAGSLLPQIQESVSAAAQDAVDPTGEALSGGAPWILWGIAAAAIVLILLLVRFIVRQGRGRTGTLIRVGSGEGAGTPTGGSVSIDAAVAEQVLEEALAHDPAIVAVDVTAFDIRHQKVLRVTAHTRRGASPVRARKTVDEAVRRWDALLGQEIPVVIQIVSGLRTRMSGTARVQ
ncbi:hypothetical protein [Rathayibacter tanaceti]|uniref:Uncharacterized protein n=2 Tax=Rathayibacter tanaceti TaxID=1671680 RepID=A0A162GN31_9MICO|nr:hypothetical protein [Rathayibacter tanaceti]KZX20218.1 hypothetical protein ACH61_02671 [Rathayibacter tanaceti]QHC56799.1 hypothetical protein GSU10_14960 [Rathayibacter tanaceti]TCO33776.1 hypothetical protein EV639_11459 [Rathayibacter tanaceti]